MQLPVRNVGGGFSLRQERNAMSAAVKSPYATMAGAEAPAYNGPHLDRDSIHSPRAGGRNVRTFNVFTF